MFLFCFLDVFFSYSQKLILSAIKIPIRKKKSKPTLFSSFFVVLTLAFSFLLRQMVSRLQRVGLDFTKTNFLIELRSNSLKGSA